MQAGQAQGGESSADRLIEAYEAFTDLSFKLTCGIKLPIAFVLAEISLRAVVTAFFNNC
jgi:hypothetical protein